MNFVEGMVVKSDAGRDQERYYAVVAVEDGFPRIADGKLHKLCRPKKKNPRHLKRTGQRIELSEAATDAALRRALRGLNEGASSAEPF